MRFTSSRRRRIAAAATTAVILVASPRPLQSRSTPAIADALAIVDVSVVPMDADRVLEHQTVVVRGDRIESLGPASRITVPDGAARIDGRGKFLMPGLVDMHLHAVPGAGEKNDLAGQQIRLLVANGVTTARSLGGPPTALEVRARIARGEIVGPQLLLAGPSLHGNSVKSAAQARQMITEQKQRGFDLLKTHGGIPRDIYDTIVAVAREQGMPLSGHVTPHVGLAHAIASGQQVEHLDGYIAAVLRDAAPVPPPAGQFPLDETLDYVDPRKVDSVVRAVVAARAWNGPTVALFALALSDSTAEQLAARPEMRYLPKTVADAWVNRRRQAPFAQIPKQRREQFVALRRDLVRKLHAAGAKLLAGSDSPQEFMVSGFSLHEELEALAALGLSPFATLATATRNPAEYLGMTDQIGSIAVGKRADLLLLDANPLADVRNARRVSGVAVRGRWLDRATLDELLRFE